MTNNDFIKCPFCEGHGQLHRAEILNRVSRTDFRKKIESWLAEISRSSDEQKAATTVTANGSKAQDFEKEVHNWNPERPIWRRSPKE